MGNRLPSATLTLLLAGSPLLTSPAAAQARLPRRFDADVARALREFQVPGAAIAIVKDGRVGIIRRLGAAPPVSSFRSQYAYDNVLYAAAGEIVPAVTGKTWETFVRDRILTPLGMTETRVGVADLRPGDPFAAPHAVLDGRLQIVPLDTVDNIAPAAALISSVTDLSRWLLVQLDSGRAGVARLWTARRTREMWSAQTILPIADPDPPLAALRPNFAAYGLGWRLRDYRG